MSETPRSVLTSRGGYKRIAGLARIRLVTPLLIIIIVIAAVFLGYRRDSSEQPVSFVVNAGGEEQCGARTGTRVITAISWQEIAVLGVPE